MRAQPKPGHGSANPADELVCNKHTTAVCYSPAYTKNNTKTFFSKSLCTSVPVHEGTLLSPRCLHPRSPQGQSPGPNTSQKQSKDSGKERCCAQEPAPGCTTSLLFCKVHVSVPSGHPCTWQWGENPCAAVHAVEEVLSNTDCPVSWHTAGQTPAAGFVFN